MVALLGPPAGFPDPLAGLPDGVTVRRRLQGSPDVVVAYFTRRARLEARIDALGRSVFPAASVWIAWPKRASKVPTDITEDTIREVALPLGLVDVKVCAIDDTWSGLKLMWRRDRR